MEAHELADQFLLLQALGCHNLNLDPTHFVPSIVEALLAAPKGFHLPVSTYCGGYESVEALRRLEGIVSITCADIQISRRGGRPRKRRARLSRGRLRRGPGDAPPGRLADPASRCAGASPGSACSSAIWFSPAAWPARPEWPSSWPARLPGHRAQLDGAILAAFQAHRPGDISNRRPRPEELAEALQVCRVAGLQRFLWYRSLIWGQSPVRRLPIQRPDSTARRPNVSSG